MPKRSSVAFILMLAACTAGVIASAGKRCSVDDPALTPATATVPEAVAPRPGRGMSIAINTMMIACIVAILALAALPLIARAAPASNEDIRNHYGINVVDNVNFKGDTFLKMGEDDLAYVCDRPNLYTLRDSREIHCWQP